MTTVELIYDADCPNVGAAREQLESALAEVGRDRTWRDWDRSDPASPSYVQSYGSPTILVDGRDVAGASPSDAADCCRLYGINEGQFQGVPSVEMIASALRASRPASSDGWAAATEHHSWLATFPAVVVALLPAVACPACWPAYAGLLSAIGLPVLMDVAYLLPLTLVALAVATGALAVRAKSRRGHLPFLLGTSAAVMVVVGKFALVSAPATYAGIALLLGANVWNSWPKRSSPDGPCASCAGR